VTLFASILLVLSLAFAFAVLKYVEGRARRQADRANQRLAERLHSVIDMKLSELEESVAATQQPLAAASAALTQSVEALTKLTREVEMTAVVRDELARLQPSPSPYPPLAVPMLAQILQTPYLSDLLQDLDPVEPRVRWKTATRLTEASGTARWN
jgi:hypothetical protein